MNTTCIDCGKEVVRDVDEYHMVQHFIWRSATKSHERHSILCMECIELRIGRNLTGADFLNCPVNTSNQTVLQKLKEYINNQ